MTDIRRRFFKNGAEYVVDAVGSSKTKIRSLDLVEPGGAVTWVGLMEDSVELGSECLTLEQKCICGVESGSLSDLRKAVQMLASGILETHWAKRYPLDDAEVGFREMLSGAGNNIKGIVELAR